MVVISPENFGTSTMLLESMILGKPTMNIFCNEQIHRFNHVESNAVFTINDQSDIEKNLEKILFDKEFLIFLKFPLRNLTFDLIRSYSFLGQLY